MKVFVIVDMQNDFITGPLGSERAVAAADNILKFLKLNNSSNNIVLFTKDTHQENYLDTQEGQWLPIEHCIEGTPGWSIYKPISEFVDKESNFSHYSQKGIIKGRILKSAFGSLDLAKVLQQINTQLAARGEKLEEVIFMGVCTDICVISNVLIAKAALPETMISILKDGCAGSTDMRQFSAFEIMRSCQINFYQMHNKDN